MSSFWQDGKERAEERRARPRRRRKKGILVVVPLAADATWLAERGKGFGKFKIEAAQVPRLGQEVGLHTMIYSHRQYEERILEHVSTTGAISNPKKLGPDYFPMLQLLSLPRVSSLVGEGRTEGFLSRRPPPRERAKVVGPALPLGSGPARGGAP
jgi:hypothetical protein